MKDIIDENSRIRTDDLHTHYTHNYNNNLNNKSMLDRVEEENINFRPLIKKKDDSFAKLPHTDVVTLNKLGTGGASSKVLN